MTLEKFLDILSELELWQVRLLQAVFLLIAIPGIAAFYYVWIHHHIEDTLDVIKENMSDRFHEFRESRATLGFLYLAYDQRLTDHLLSWFFAFVLASLLLLFNLDECVLKSIGLGV